MSRPPLWEIAVETGRSAEEPVAALLERIFGTAAAIYAPAEGARSSVTVYSERLLRKSGPQTAELSAGLAAIEAMGLSRGKMTLRTRKVRREDWSESWKKYFKTIAIRSELLIRPSWSKQRPKPGQASVVLDPGLSFGTGQHPTTAYCLEQLVRFRPSSSASFLDLGTGSGILAIAAVKLGYQPVCALDLDPQAVRIASANARRNRVAKRVSIRQGNVARLRMRPSQRFDLVCANLVDDLLIRDRDRILAQVSASGRLVVAGILSRQFQRVKARYARAGWKCVATKKEGEWQSGVFAPA